MRREKGGDDNGVKAGERHLVHKKYKGGWVRCILKQADMKAVDQNTSILYCGKYICTKLLFTICPKYKITDHGCHGINVNAWSHLNIKTDCELKHLHGNQRVCTFIWIYILYRVIISWTADLIKMTRLIFLLGDALVMMAFAPNFNRMSSLENRDFGFRHECDFS